jgi:hypothetical protein
LLRFAGMMVSGEARIGRLVDALERRFEGLGAPGTISVYLTGEGGEYMARESVYNLQYHTGVFAEGTTAEKVALREPKRLNFLRRKFEADLAAGEKIWVWQSMDTHQIDQVLPLLHALRAAGPNRLLWVVECDADHKPGTAERLDRDFFKGYVDHFNSLSLELCAASWIDACQSAYDLCFATEPAPTHPAADIAPAHPVAGIAPADRVANEVPAHSVSDRAPPARPPPAIDCLARNQPTPPASASPVFARRAWGFGGIMSTVLRHLRGQRT